MPTNFPSSLDSFISPTANDSLNSADVPHALQHTNLNDAMESVQAKVGVDNSSDANSLDYKINRQIDIFRTHRSSATVVQAQNTTRYYPVLGSLLSTETDETLVQVKMPRAGRVKLLRTILANTVGGSGQTVTSTVRKNASNTSLATVHNSGETGIKEDTTEVTFAAGDLISTSVVTSASTGNINIVAHELHVEFSSS